MRRSFPEESARLHTGGAKIQHMRIGFERAQNRRFKGPTVKKIKKKAKKNKNKRVKSQICKLMRGSNRLAGQHSRAQPISLKW